MIFSNVRDQVGVGTPGTLGYTFTPELINDTWNNSDTQIVQNDTDYSLTWRGNISAAVNNIFEAWYNASADTWTQSEVCAVIPPLAWADQGDITLSSSNNHLWAAGNGVNVITYANIFGNVTLAYGGFETAWACCDIYGDPLLVQDAGKFGTDVEVLFTGEVGVVYGIHAGVRDLHFVNCPAPCAACVQEPIDQLNNAYAYPALVYNENLTRWEVMYLEMNAGAMRHAYRIGVGVWGDKGVVKDIGGNEGWNRPGIDGVDISNTNETAWCARDLATTNLTVVYGHTGDWTIEDTGGDLGRYCSITINETEGPRSAHVLYQGSGADLWHASSTLGTGVWTHELLDGNNSHYTDVLTDFNTDVLVGSYGHLDDWSTWFGIDTLTGSGGTSGSAAANVTEVMITNLSVFNTWIPIIIILLSVGLVVYSLTRVSTV